MAKSKQICDLKDCTGCMACANACSHGAISIEVSELGFKYPYILPDKCVECGLCKKVCPSLNVPTLIFPKKCYAVKVKDEDLLFSCASGGASTALAITVISEGGVVCGCSGENMAKVKHIIVDKESDLYRLKGSKYVQSEISTTLYKQIREILKSGRKVLFIGTGCQIAGLQSFLLKPYNNLITVDLVCHGVPSQKMLDDNINSYKGIDPNSVRFRIKESKSDGLQPYISGTHQNKSLYRLIKIVIWLLFWIVSHSEIAVIGVNTHTLPDKVTLLFAISGAWGGAQNRVWILRMALVRYS